MRTGYVTINPTKAGWDWSAGIQKRYNKSGYRSPDIRSLYAKSLLQKKKKFKCINALSFKINDRIVIKPLAIILTKQPFSLNTKNIAI